MIEPEKNLANSNYDLLELKQLKIWIAGYLVFSMPCVAETISLTWSYLSTS